MEQSKAICEQTTMPLNSISAMPISQPRVRWLNTSDVILFLLPLISLVVWAAFLKDINIGQMNNLGLVSVLPLPTICSFVLINVSFCLALCQPRLRLPIILFHIFVLIFMLFSITNFVEDTVRFSTVYRHAGYTEYIMRTGSVNPNLDAYFNWPGFFIFSALLTQLAGYHDILQYAAWAPVFLNLIYLPPLYVLLTTATTDRRLIWLSIWLFYITNWIGQDYYSPQGLCFFFYLTLLAIVLKWFKVSPNLHIPRKLRFLRSAIHSLSFIDRLHTWLTEPDTLHTPISERKQKWLLVLFIVIFSFLVYSHPLTPVFVLVSIGTLILLRRCKPWWLPILIGAMTIIWILLMAQVFLSGHSNLVVGSIGHIDNIVSTNVTNRVLQGDPQHAFVADMRVVMTLALWVLASLGAVKRLTQGHHDGTYLLLAVAPFPLLIAQGYGGEMLLRIYLFAQPFMVFFAASLLYPSHHFFIRGTPRLTTLACIVICVFLVAGFFITRYGNENIDYMTSDEVSSVEYLYEIAPSHSLLLAAWDNTPWQFRDYEQYTCASLNTMIPNSVTTGNTNVIVRFIEQQHEPVFIIFTRSQRADAESFANLSEGTLDRLEHNLLATGKFTLVLNHKDAQILAFNTRD